ncbi:hypothetical protein L484_003108 [Morus notabilis]|uniref:Uncharacterized protein n=1 Tax=Morus notabilis TaxID=981085 RepID=W9SRG3_9ROSA|nr:hypothetical protein L484_003108 [Morus notabilis]
MGDGRRSDIKSVAVVGREGSFDVTADGPCSDITSHRRSHPGCRAREELQSNGRWVAFGHQKMPPFSS